MLDHNRFENYFNLDICSVHEKLFTLFATSKFNNKNEMFYFINHRIKAMLSFNSIDHSLDYYQFPAETKTSGIYHDTDIEEAEDDDEDYNEESSFRNDNKLDSLDNTEKLKFDQKIR